MSVSELKKIVDESTPEEREFLRDYLAERFPEQDVLHADKFDQIMRDMDQGHKVTWEELQKAHEKLKDHEQ